MAQVHSVLILQDPYFSPSHEDVQTAILLLELDRIALRTSATSNKLAHLIVLTINNQRDRIKRRLKQTPRISFTE
jgi:hypothetical protein